MIRRLALALSTLMALLVTLPAARADVCRDLEDHGAAYTVCTVETGRGALRLYLRDSAGQPYATFSQLAAALAQTKQTLVFAMNAGMFEQDLSPVGLYVEGGAQRKAANTRDGPGNFHMKPNGVFWFGPSGAGVMETRAYLDAHLHPAFATQSGPMLVIDGGDPSEAAAGRHLAEDPQRRRRARPRPHDRLRDLARCRELLPLREPVQRHSRLRQCALPRRDDLEPLCTGLGAHDAAAARRSDGRPDRAGARRVRPSRGMTMSQFESLARTIEEAASLEAALDALFEGLAQRIKTTSNDQNVQKLSRELRIAAPGLVAALTSRKAAAA